MIDSLRVAILSAAMLLSGCGVDAPDVTAIREPIIHSLSELESLSQIVSAERLSGEDAAHYTRLRIANYWRGDLDHLVIYEIVYKTPDGARLQGFILAPKDYAEVVYPILIRSEPEGYAGGLSWLGRRDAVRFSTEGFIVMQFNHRHDRGNRAQEYDLYDTTLLANLQGGRPSQYGGADLYDITTLIDISEHFGFSADELFLKGDMRTYILLRHETRIDAAITYRAIADFESFYMAFVDDIEFIRELARERNQPQELTDAMTASHKLTLERIRAATGGSIEEAPEEFFNRSAIHWADEIDTPILFLEGPREFLHGTQGVYDLMREAGRDVKRVVGETITLGEFEEKLFESAIYWLRTRPINY